MKSLAVKELMVPLDEYATVNENANLAEAVLALDEAQQSISPGKHAHRAVLVLDAQRRVVGKCDMFDILMALEPKYVELEASGTLASAGHSPELIESMLRDHYLWSETMESICNRSVDVKVRDFMETPADGAYIDGTATRDHAIHQLIISRHQSLLVTEEGRVIGILRLSDVFSEICDAIKSCLR